jgi:hypothetical protein
MGLEPLGRLRRSTCWPSRPARCATRTGGCPKDRFTTTPDGEAGLNYLCPSFKRFFGHVAAPMQEMAELLAHGRAPSEFIRRYDTELTIARSREPT